MNPSGKLPITFPTSLSGLPANTAAQWPGTNSEVQYSEGLDVGYRWYDANNVTPLYPFGYGLSYTTFSYSNLNVGTLSNGQATVTATVTNTGSRAGADVAQLYVGDPASAGEPPHQLKGFQRIALNPGASRRSPSPSPPTTWRPGTPPRTTGSPGPVPTTSWSGTPHATSR